MFVNTSQKRLCISQDRTTSYPALDDRPLLVAGAKGKIALTFLDQAGALLPLAAGVTICAAVDTDYDHTDDLIAYAAQSDVEIDHATSSAIITLDCATLAAKSKITKERTRVKLQVMLYAAGETTPVVLLQDVIPMSPSVIDSEGAPVPGAPEYLTAEQVQTLVAAVSGANMSIEFSVDGSVWSADATGAYFWRFRISETAAWSAAIPIPQPAAVAGAVAYSFTVAEGSTATEKSITWATIGTVGKTPVRLYQVQSDNSELDITANSRLQIVLNASGVTLFWANDAFPAGNYVIRG